MRRPALYIAAAFSLGIFLSSVLNPPPLYVITFNIIFLLLAVLSSGRKNLSLLNLYLAILCLGIVFYQNSGKLPSEHISNFVKDDNSSIFIRGRVIDDPMISRTYYGSDRKTFVVQADSIGDGSSWHRCAGLVKTDIYNDKVDIGFGDEVLLEGILSRTRGLKNPGLFDYSKYLAIKDIYVTLKVKKNFRSEILSPSSSGKIMKSLAYTARERIRKSIDAYFREPDGGFLKAILIGERASLSETVNQDFIKTGTVHILSISGQHVTLVALVILFLLSLIGVPRRARFILASVVLIFYFFLAGSSPPVGRAVVMFLVFAIGSVVYRQTDILNVLAVAALIILAQNPKELFDPSFQMSFLSIIAIVAFAPRIENLIHIKPDRRDISKRIIYYLWRCASVSIAASIGLAPVVALYFNIVSPIAVAANLVVIPLIFLIMVLSFLFVALSTICGYMAGLAATVLQVLDATLFSVNRFLSELPFSYFRIAAPSGCFLILYYVALFTVFTVPQSLAAGRVTVSRKHLIMALLILLTLLIWKGNIDPAERLLRMTFLDVGQGDSIFVEFPGKGNMLVDAGSGGEEGRFDIGRSVVAPFLWNKGMRRIDALVVTHSHEDHLGGAIFILKNFDIGCVIDNGIRYSGESSLLEEYLALIRGKHIRHIEAVSPTELTGFGEVNILILNPPADAAGMAENDRSIVLKIIYKNFSALLCGDVTEAGIGNLLHTEGILKSDLLKVPHHGGGTGDLERKKYFFKKIDPVVYIISASDKGRQKGAVKYRTQDIITSGAISYVTKDDGAVMIATDGHSFKGKSESGKKTNFFILYLDNRYII